MEGCHSSALTECEPLKVTSATQHALRGLARDDHCV